MTSTYDPDVAEALLPLAFSLHANPGAYAVVAGAGMSYGAVPVAWQVFTDLISRAAGQYGETVDREAAEGWYLQKFGSGASYESVLEKLGPTPTERQGILRGFFEPDGQLPEPTEAHRAVARLMKSGAVRIVVTMNFDRLFEQALREEGIEPLVVATDAQAASLGPLHAAKNCVIHLHGDYQDALSLRNTADELSRYPDSIRAVLEQVVREYGLIIAGWSAEYDPALREAIEQNYPRRYTATWIDPADMRGTATEMLARLQGQRVQATADEAFGHLVDAVESLRTRQSRNPLTLPVAIETAKRELSGRHTSIALHDRLQSELQRLHKLDVFTRINGSSEEYRTAVDRVEEASAIPVALVGVLAYWGSADTDQWWIEEIERFARIPLASGSTVFLEARRLAGTRLLYAASIGALAARRYGTFRALSRLTTPDIYRSGQEAVFDALSAAKAYKHVNDREHRHYQHLKPILHDALGLTQNSLDTAWQRFEILRMALTLLAHPQFKALCETYCPRGNYYYQIETKIRQTRDDPDQSQARADLEQKKPAAREDMERALEPLSQLVKVGNPHVLVKDPRSGDMGRWLSPVAENLRQELATDRELHPMVGAGLGNHISLLAAVDAVQHQIGGHATYRLHNSRPSAGMWSEPDEFWLDEPILT